MTSYSKNINNIFYIFVTAHLIFWTLIPTITNHNLPLDVIEALAWGSNLDWGFSKHPPGSAFFPEIFFQIFGPQDWAYYLLSQIFVIISFFYVFWFSKEILNNDLLSLISVLLIESIYFYNFTTPEFNVNVCQLPFWAATVYYSWKIYRSKEIKFTDCFLVGLFAAFGFLSKYLFLYLLISIDLLFIYLIFFKHERKFDFKYLITVEVFLIVLIPHLIWLNNNEFITIKYGLARTGLDQSSIIDHIKFPIIFLSKQIGTLIPFLLLICLLVKKFKFNFNFKDKKLLFLIAINILPIVLIFLTSVITGFKIRTMWMTPFYLFFGTLFVYLFQAQINFKKLKPFMYGFIFLFFLSPVLYAYISISKDDKRTDYPGKGIALKTQYAWDRQFNSAINVVYGNEWNAGNLSYHLKSRPVWEGFVEREKIDKLKNYMCLDNICVGSR
jgi:4-amino-4-deoxy-L-arabinose transferase-like glycosyltransferase